MTYLPYPGSPFYIIFIDFIMYESYSRANEMEQKIERLLEKLIGLFFKVITIQFALKSLDNASAQC